jgi:hypothetical protein
MLLDAHPSDPRGLGRHSKPAVCTYQAQVVHLSAKRNTASRCLQSIHYTRPNVYPRTANGNGGNDHGGKLMFIPGPLS